MQHTILVAYDGTESAERAFEAALDLARRTGARLHVIAVASAAEVETHVMLDRIRIECAAYLEPLPRRGADPHVEVEVEVSEGIAPWEIAGARKSTVSDWPMAQER
jgi:nucleotide-binding universal stress UspA family protein